MPKSYPRRALTVHACTHALRSRLSAFHRKGNPSIAMSVFLADRIKASLPSHALLLELLASSFADMHAGRIVLGPVSHIDFAPAMGNQDDADCCIKSAYLKTGSTWVVKVAAGWYKNPQLVPPLPSSVGLMLVFCLKTGVPKAVLLDGGFLTDLRTALAACVTARALAPKTTRAIGLVGAGTICRLIVEVLHSVGLSTRKLHIWARRPAAAQALADQAGRFGWQASGCDSLHELAGSCDLIFTCTPSKEPLLLASHVALRPKSAPGLHICALGSDQEGKQELEPALLGMASLIVADSVSQCFSYGECCHAKRLGILSEQNEQVVPLGLLLSPTHAHLQRGAAEGRGEDRRLTIADSTGVGASDWCIAEAAYRALVPGSPPPPPMVHKWRAASLHNSKL